MNLEILTRKNFSRFHTLSIGSLRSYDCNCKENVWKKLNFALSLLRLFHVDQVLQNRWSALSRVWHEWFSCKGKEEKIYCCDLPLSSEPQIWKFPVVVRQTTPKACRTCSTIIFLHSTDEIIDLWRCRWRCRRQILSSLMTVWMRSCRYDAADQWKST